MAAAVAITLAEKIGAKLLPALLDKVIALAAIYCHRSWLSHSAGCGLCTNYFRKYKSADAPALGPRSTAGRPWKTSCRR
jgi:hypothetical protein